jgi:2-polyprenyl-6-hydroxyphenyl methylase/3-demethylubiquinone-9 3-methyltransferase
VTGKNAGETGLRFEFGENWTRYLSGVDEDRIREAERSLRQMLEVETLEGATFLDIGSGSGLFSLSARRMGARVCSFDYDRRSVECTKALKDRYFAVDEKWTVAHGDVLNPDFLRSLGCFDIVYSWGVLHHTGAMWKALENVGPLVGPQGKLFISIYNDQGATSHRWRALKKCYNDSSKLVRLIIILGVGTYWELLSAAFRLIHLRNPFPFKKWKEKKKDRGMSVWYDLVDWVGGYPFEVAKPEEILHFYRKKGFCLLRLKTCGGGHGCNEYVFAREHRGSDTPSPV